MKETENELIANCDCYGKPGWHYRSDCPVLALFAAAKEAVRHFERDGVHDLDQCSPLDALRAAVEAVEGRKA